MAPKREAEPLPGDDKFGGDYSDEKRRQVSRSDGARKRGVLKYKLGEPVPAGWHRRDLPEFDRLRRLGEIEIRRREQLRLHGEGSSSAGASSSLLLLAVRAFAPPIDICSSLLELRPLTCSI